MNASFSLFLNLSADFDDKNLMRLVILFIVLSYLNLGHANCDRKSINNAWFAIKDAAKERDVSTDLNKFTNRLASCNQRIASAGEITQRNIDRYRRYGYLAEFRKRIAIIENGDSFPIDETLEWARRANQRVSIVEKKIRKLQDKARQKCTTRDYRNKLPPIRDQDSMGWCFAFAAADIASFKKGKAISAMDIALGYYNDGWLKEYLHNLGLRSQTQASDLSTGWGKQALEKISSRGVCLEANLPSEDFTYSDGTTSLKETISRIEAAASNEEDRSTPSEVTHSSAGLPSQISIDQYIIQDTARTEVLNKIRRLACTDRISFPYKFKQYKRKPDASVVERASNNFFRDIINSQLNSNNILLISHNIKMFEDSRVNNMGTSHESLIVGQKWNEQAGRCDFLIRNSWGSNCNYIDSSYKCEKDGHFWMPSSSVINGTKYVTHTQ